jgi:cation:H+ antiporter
MAAGLVMLGFGSQWVVDGATAIARDLGVSELIVGLTIIAVGTSLPEIATSLVALRRREQDMAVGNVIGSSIFNIVGVVPVLALLSPGGVDIALSARVLDIPLMLVAGVVCLPIFFTGYRITRWEGVVLVAWYCAYAIFLVLDPIDYGALDRINWIVLAFIAPLTLITLIVVWQRSRHRLPQKRDV